MPVAYQDTKLGFDATVTEAEEVQLPVPEIIKALKFEVLG